MTRTSARSMRMRYRDHTPRVKQGKYKRNKVARFVDHLSEIKVVGRISNDVLKGRWETVKLWKGTGNLV